MLQEQIKKLKVAKLIFTFCIVLGALMIFIGGVILGLETFEYFIELFEIAENPSTGSEAAIYTLMEKLVFDCLIYGILEYAGLALLIVSIVNVVKKSKKIKKLQAQLVEQVAIDTLENGDLN